MLRMSSFNEFQGVKNYGVRYAIFRCYSDYVVSERLPTEESSRVSSVCHGSYTFTHVSMYFGLNL